MPSIPCQREIGSSSKNSLFFFLFSLFWEIRDLTTATWNTLHVNVRPTRWLETTEINAFYSCLCHHMQFRNRSVCPYISVSSDRSGIDQLSRYVLPLCGGTVLSEAVVSVSVLSVLWHLKHDWAIIIHKHVYLENKNTLGMLQFLLYLSNHLVYESFRTCILRQI